MKFVIVLGGNSKLRGGISPLKALKKNTGYSHTHTHTHTHTICYKMAFDLHPIICTWDVVATYIPITVVACHF